MQFELIKRNCAFSAIPMGGTFMWNDAPWMKIPDVVEKPFQSGANLRNAVSLGKKTELHSFSDIANVIPTNFGLVEIDNNGE